MQDIIDDIDRAAFSPRTALDALKELIDGPCRRSIQLRVRQPRNTTGKYTIEATTLKEMVNDRLELSPGHEYHMVQRLSGYSQEQAKRLAIYGFQPILERLMIPPSELSCQTAAWLRIAATTCTAQMDPDFPVLLPSPQLLLDPNTKETFIRLRIQGCDPAEGENKDWTFYKDVHLDSVPDVVLPIHPLHDNFRWSEVSLKDVGEDIGNAILTTSDYQLAKTITSALNGFLGPSASARQTVETMLIRYAARSAHAEQAFVRIGSSFSLDAINNIIPWKIVPTSKGRIKITVKAEIRASVLSQYKPVRIVS